MQHLCWGQADSCKFRDYLLPCSGLWSDTIIVRLVNTKESQQELQQSQYTKLRDQQAAVQNKHCYEMQKSPEQWNKEKT